MTVSEITRERQLDTSISWKILFGVFGVFISSFTIYLPYFPTYIGYGITLLAATISLTYTTVRLKVSFRISRVVLLCFGLYILGLSTLAIIFPTGPVIQYTIAGIITFSLLLAIFPQAALDRPYFTLKLISLFGVVLTVFGVGMLMLEYTTQTNLYPEVANPIIGGLPVKTTSLTSNSTIFGFIAFITASASLYTWHRGDPPFTLLINGTGLFLSGAEGSYLAFFATAVLWFTMTNQKYLRLLVPTAGGGLLIGIFTGYVQEFLKSGLHGRMYLAYAGFRRAFDNPLTGIRFQNIGAEISPYVPEAGVRYQGLSTHNFYAHILVNVGFIVGVPLLVGVWYTVIKATVTQSSDFDAIVAAMGWGILIDFLFRQQTLGGLSSVSLLSVAVFGLCGYTVVRKNRVH